ncbi:MAG: hypothetical protein AMS15_02655 [Planctomycetes bacterium DG_23]|nr:MAG: hypothetical protein AMS15_02655 [Planctomycetes bacterium DG_23]
MKIARLTIYHIEIPFKRRFAHARAERTRSDSVVVKVSLENGLAGFGEGCPRSYVTGETAESVFSVIQDSKEKVASFSPANFAEALEILRSFRLDSEKKRPRLPSSNAARCALELALLDLSSKCFQRSFAEILETLLPQDVFQPPRPVRYSAVISTGSLSKQITTALAMRLFGFRQIKVKVEDSENDAKKLRLLRRTLGKKKEMRIDINQAFSFDQAVRFFEGISDLQVAGVEEPLVGQELERLKELKVRFGLPLIADESLVTLEDARYLAEGDLMDIFDIRLSKCGGLMPSAAIIEFALKNGIGYGLGSHVGETGILSAAGRWLASSVAGLKFLEGSYDRFLLKENITFPDITLGYGGKAPPLSGLGLGVNVDEEALETVATRKEEITF